MENAKYYTPTINEFYPGFEFEVKEVVTSGFISKSETKYVSRSAIWHKAVLSLSLISKTRVIEHGEGDTVKLSNWSAMDYSLTDVEKLLSENSIRVKHLDREDIENLLSSMGFEVEKDEHCNGGFTNEYLETMSLKVEAHKDGTPMLFISKDKETGLWDIEIDETRRIYELDIRNVSELRKIMKMLNIKQ